MSASITKLLKKVYLGKIGQGEGHFVNTPARLYQVAHNFSSKITHRAVREFLRQQTDRQIVSQHSNQIPRFKSKRHILVSRAGLNCCLDTMVLRRFRGAGLFRFALICIDLFSKKLFVAFQKNLNPKNTAAALIRICRMEHIPGWLKCWSDSGQEFSKKFDKIVIDQEHIIREHYRTSGKIDNISKFCSKIYNQTNYFKDIHLTLLVYVSVGSRV